MERRDFLSKLGVSTAAVCVGGLASCTKTSPVAPGPASINLANQITAVGDYLTQNNITVIRLATGNVASSFVALNNTCTHAGCTVSYQSTQQEFFCPCHGSIFDNHGNVLQGPAYIPLSAYQVT
ncbi:MAG: QcrA and Rieske domain-containing protein, partial [Chitinophagaceae bacterium]